MICGNKIMIELIYNFIYLAFWKLAFLIVIFITIFLDTHIMHSILQTKYFHQILNFLKLINWEFWFSDIRYNFNQNWLTDLIFCDSKSNDQLNFPRNFLIVWLLKYFKPELIIRFELLLHENDQMSCLFFQLLKYFNQN